MRKLTQYILLVGLLGTLSACSPSGAEAQQSSETQTKQAVVGNWLVDKSASAISFTGTMSGDEFIGRFGDFDANIRFDADNLNDADIHVSIDMTTADANDPERNDALPGKEWFYTKSFPQAIFKSSQVSKISDGEFEAVGTLTLRDVSQPLTLPFSLELNGDNAVVTAKTSINRSEYGVGTGMWKNEDWVAHKVDININLVASPK